MTATTYDDLILPNQPSPLVNLTLYTNKWPPFSNQEIWMGVALSQMFAHSCEWFHLNVLKGQYTASDGLAHLSNTWTAYSKQTYGSWSGESEIFDETFGAIEAALPIYIRTNLIFDQNFWSISFGHLAKAYYGETWESEDLQNLALGYLHLYGTTLQIASKRASEIVSDLETQFSERGTLNTVAIQAAEKVSKTFVHDYEAGPDYDHYFDVNLMLPEFRELILRLVAGNNLHDTVLAMSPKLWDMFSPDDAYYEAHAVINQYVNKSRKNRLLLEESDSSSFDYTDSPTSKETEVSYDCVLDTGHSWISTSRTTLACINCGMISPPTDIE